MTNFRPAVDQQPTPIRRDDLTPAWDNVIRYAETKRCNEILIADMRDRRQFGLDKYGTLLTAYNGRNHLVDAYQEVLDLLAYLSNTLVEKGVFDAALRDEADLLDEHVSMFSNAMRIAEDLCMMLRSPFK